MGVDAITIGMYLPFLHGFQTRIRIANSKQIPESIKRKDVKTMAGSNFNDAGLALI